MSQPRVMSPRDVGSGIVLDSVGVTFGGENPVIALEDVSLEDTGRRIPGDRGAVGVRQVHPAAGCLRFARTNGWDGLGARQDRGAGAQ